MFSLLTNFLRLWTNLLTVQIIVFVQEYSRTYFFDFFFFLISFSIVCTSIV